MPTGMLVNILMHALAYAPNIIAEIEQAMTQNWNHPVVQNAVQALNDVNSAMQRATAANAPTQEPETLASVAVPPV